MKNLSYLFAISVFVLSMYSPGFGVEAQSTPDIVTNTEQLAYQPGHGALELFNKDADTTTPTWVKYWINFMSLSFVLGLFFVWKRVEARWVVGGMITTIMCAFFIAPAIDMLPLGGLYALIHILTWTPGLYLMIKNKPFMGEKSFYKYWSGLITAVIIFSFIFDIRDATIYLDHMLGFGLFS